jgi:hypothetical protein
LPYRAAPTSTALGYSETQIESNRYFVTLSRHEKRRKSASLEDYALLRAAELTLQNGRDWFWVDRRTLDQQEDGALFGAEHRYWRWRRLAYGRRSGASVGVGMTFPLGNREPSGAAARASTTSRSASAKAQSRRRQRL